MSKRKYTHIQELMPEIKEMIAKGKSQREIEGLLGLSGDRPIHNLFKHERRKEKKAAAGIAPRPKGRPHNDAAPRDIVTEQAYEIKRLKMENKLRGFFVLSVHSGAVQQSAGIEGVAISGILRNKPPNFDTICIL